MRELGSYSIGDAQVDSIDLKALLVSRGLKVPGSVYRAFGDSHRLSPDPLACDCLLLPDDTVVQLTDLKPHMGYVRSAMSWDMLRQARYFAQMSTPFSLELDGDSAVLCYAGEPITDVRFPGKTGFYDQTTSSGISYRGNAVLQGTEWLSFQCLWPCDYACAGKPCEYCYSGATFEAAARKGQPMPASLTPEDAAEIAHYAIVEEQVATSIQITGGSMFNSEAESELIVRYLDAIDERVGRDNIAGEIVVYATPTASPAAIDRIFAAGADRVSLSLEIWDEELAGRIMPGKTHYTGRQRNLDCLDYVVSEYGRGKACSNFIVGLEPVESCLEGAEYLASRGVVPIASVWIPFGRPVQGTMRAPKLDYYRRFKVGLADIFRRYELEPPGGQGLNVCMCRDIQMHREAIAAGHA